MSQRELFLKSCSLKDKILLLGKFPYSTWQNLIYIYIWVWKMQLWLWKGFRSVRFCCLWSVFIRDLVWTVVLRTPIWRSVLCKLFFSPVIILPLTSYIHFDETTSFFSAFCHMDCRSARGYVSSLGICTMLGQSKQTQKYVNICFVALAGTCLAVQMSNVHLAQVEWLLLFDISGFLSLKEVFSSR